ncbi:VaFE repeat-containing surface-anchored protein [Corynebacterium freiburgense]|uniref:VaFE repeat-containing surface-anchored protein n=1 Tax=Corynebacterium freiburgense TaxID=556548 RepID=UPI00146F9FC4|nr:VaFE repeat-containing surface-anchored protein [Corynebacterium freiburgense]
MLLHLKKSRYIFAFLSALALVLGVVTVVPAARAQELGAQVKVSGGQEGLSISWGNDRRIMTRLFNIESGGTTREAYCIEYNVNVVYSDKAKTVKWDEFPGSNKFKTDEAIRHKVNWIAANSYPAVSIDQLRATVGASAEELTEQAAIAQTQGAIWSLLADEFEYKGIATDNAALKAGEFKLYEYLTGAANVGRAETSTLDLSIQMDDSKATRQPNGVMGPLKFETNAAALKITTDNGTIVDADGNPIEASDIRPGTEFYLKVDESEGEAKITASSEGDAISGALVVTPKDDGTHGQTLIVTHNDVVRKTEEFTVRWEGTNVSIKTSASDQRDADKVLAPEGGTIVDVVEYSGLIVGKKYIIKGELMDKETGEGTGIKSEKELVPTAPDGQVEVQFDVPEGYSGKTLVVFEWAYDENGNLIAEHTDINDRAQTVRVANEWERRAGGGGGFIGSLDFGSSGGNGGGCEEGAGSSGGGCGTGAALVTLAAGGLLLGALAAAGSSQTGSASGSNDPAPEGQGNGDPKAADPAPQGQGNGDPKGQGNGNPKAADPAPQGQGNGDPKGQGNGAVPNAKAAPTLANTGASVITLVLVGLVITAIGAIIVVRKRRSE